MSDIIISLRVKGIPSACRGRGKDEGGGFGPRRARASGGARRCMMAVNWALATGPGDGRDLRRWSCLAKRWPYV